MASERYEVVAAASFEEDLAMATSYMVERGGVSAARRFLDRYAELRLLLGVSPVTARLLAQMGCAGVN